MRSTGTGSRPLDRDQLEREQKSRWKSSKGVVTFEAISNIITSSSSSLLHQIHHTITVIIIIKLWMEQSETGVKRVSDWSVKACCQRTSSSPPSALPSTSYLQTYVIVTSGKDPHPLLFWEMPKKSFFLWKVFPNHNHHQHQKTVRKKPPRKRLVKDTLKTQSRHGLDEKFFFFFWPVPGRDHIYSGKYKGARVLE